MWTESWTEESNLPEICVYLRINSMKYCKWQKSGTFLLLLIYCGIQVFKVEESDRRSGRNLCLLEAQCTRNITKLEQTHNAACNWTDKELNRGNIREYEISFECTHMIVQRIVAQVLEWGKSRAAGQFGTGLSLRIAYSKLKLGKGWHSDSHSLNTGNRKKD